ncbi:MAG TPA: hypothetical protein VEF71_23235 [Streptosporangiaceae bacterium]|nr:hypothetical protein [Streptosporangiaceae bacterium]
MAIVVLMLTVKELVLSPDGTVFEPLGVVVVDDVDDDDDDEQPAAVTAATAATTSPIRRKRRNVPSLCGRKCRPCSLLLPSLIPHTPFA